MEKNLFASILTVVVGGLVNMIIDKTGDNETEAFSKLYNSRLYEMLENEKTKVWTYSVPMLFDLYQTEAATGELVLPEY